ncbi:HYR domain-containing protein [Candidatus Nitrosopelagicus sp.]|nr:HYR domain-containing protein [Candidatus Nitrosopelagicus sp.]
MKILLFSILVIFAIGLYALPDAFAELSITDDATGGDCSTVGTWDAGTRTCTFTSDVSENIVISANNIILDGNGVNITGSPNTNYDQNYGSGDYNWQYYCQGLTEDNRAFSFNAKTNLVIKNFTVKDFCGFVIGDNSINNSFQGNTITETQYGITLSNSVGDSITNNVFTDIRETAIQLEGKNFIITGNTITDPSNQYFDPNNYTGWRLETVGGINVSIHYGSDTNVIENNTISGVRYGIFVSNGNYYNNEPVTVKNNSIGPIIEIGIQNCQRCHIFDNTLTYNGEFTYFSDNTVGTGINVGYAEIHDNTISGFQTGIGLSNFNLVYHNTISNNNYGIQSWASSQVVHNNFVNNEQNQGNGSDFDKLDTYDWTENSEVINSGNYWSDYSGICTDSDSDSICDDPYPFSGGTVNIEDNYVWTVQDGWLTQINTPGNITLGAPDNSGVVGTYSAVSATHDGSAMSVTCDTSSGATFPIGTTNVICTAQNGIKSTFDVTVNLETTSPVINVPSDMTINLPQGSTNSTATFSVTATDNYAVTVGPTCSPESGATLQIGNNEIYCTAADAAGNVGTAVFFISVIEYDTTPPTVSVPSDMTLDEIASNVGAVGVFSVSATDNVDGSITPTCSHSSGTQFFVGSTTVTCTAQDANGNTGTASFTITIVEYTPPYLNISNAGIFTNSLADPVSEVSIGQQTQIKVDLVNNQNSYQEFGFMISHTGPESGVTWVTSQLDPGQSFSPSLSWTPQLVGDYTFTIRVVEALYDDMSFCTSYDSSLGRNVVDISSQCVLLADAITLQLSVPLPPQTTTIQYAQGSSMPGCEPNCFIPSQASAAVGDTVTFVNSDMAPHTTTSGTPSGEGYGIWDSGIMTSGSSYSVTLNNSGTYPYFCMVHPWMTGTIYVGTGIPEAPQPDAELNLSLSKSEFDLDELITVGASISDNSGTSNVTIDVIDPNGTPIITRTLQVGSSSEQLDFRISDRFLVGYYKISASSNVNGNIITDNVFFNIKSQYDKFQIQTVQVTDQQGNASTLQRGEMAHIKVTLTSNINIEPLVTVNLFDTSLTTLGVGSIRTPINEGESEIILSFLIPDDAALGSGVIYVNAFTDWISNGGVSLTGEVSKTENIS